MSARVSVRVPAMPRAHGGPAGRARLRAEPEHFHVSEELGFEPDGEGDHALLEVVKRGANTAWVARRLAQHAGVAERDVGYAGLKDRHAVTVQFFTVPFARRGLEFWQGYEGEGFRVERAARTRRKLRRGVHRGNRFRLELTALEGDRDDLRFILERLAESGAPNYFGPQRFGRDGANLRLAHALSQPGHGLTRGQRGFALSAARAAIFNAALAERVQRETWNRLVAGDVANLAGSRSIFAVERVDELLATRCRTFDLHPTGPLWGRGELATRGETAELEQDIVGPYRGLADLLVAHGLEQERRALRTPLTDLAWTFEKDALVLAFSLPRGAYATAVVGELVDTTFEAEEDAD